MRALRACVLLSQPDIRELIKQREYNICSSKDNFPQGLVEVLPSLENIGLLVIVVYFPRCVPGYLEDIESIGQTHHKIQ